MPSAAQRFPRRVILRPSASAIVHAASATEPFTACGKVVPTTAAQLGPQDEATCRVCTGVLSAAGETPAHARADLTPAP